MIVLMLIILQEIFKGLTSCCARPKCCPSLQDLEKHFKEKFKGAKKALLKSDEYISGHLVQNAPIAALESESEEE